jgi:hypothetical protein
MIVASLIWIIGIWSAQQSQNLSAPALPNLIHCAYTKSATH